jgi:hypothetical protein
MRTYHDGKIAARSWAGVHKTSGRVPGREDGRARIPEISGADDRIEAKAILGIPTKPDPGVVDLGWGGGRGSLFGRLGHVLGTGARSGL